MFKAALKDFRLVSISGFIFGLFLLPILENVKPEFWRLNFANAALVVIGFTLFYNLALWIANLISRKFPPLWQFSKYVAVGFMSAAVNFGILNFFSLVTGVFSGFSIIVFNILAFFITITNAFFWHKFWSFEKKSAPHLAEYSQFVGVTVLSGLIDSGVVYVLTTVIGAPEFFSPALWENISKVIAAVPVVIWNFLFYKFWIFKHEKV